MSYNGQAILRDENGDPIPQIWDNDLDNWKPWTGETATLEQIKQFLLSIDSKDFASDTELQAIKSELESVISELEAIKANQTSGEQIVQVSGNIFGADLSDRPPADSVPVGTTFTLANADLDTWITNGVDWVEV